MLNALNQSSHTRFYVSSLCVSLSCQIGTVLMSISSELLLLSLLLFSINIIIKYYYHHYHYLLKFFSGFHNPFDCHSVFSDNFSYFFVLVSAFSCFAFCVFEQSPMNKCKFFFVFVLWSVNQQTTKQQTTAAFKNVLNSLYYTLTIIRKLCSSK